MRSTFNVLFYVKKSQPKKNGLCPIMGRRQSRSIQLQIRHRPQNLGRGRRPGFRAHEYALFTHLSPWSRYAGFSVPFLSLNLRKIY